MSKAESCPGRTSTLRSSTPAPNTSERWWQFLEITHTPQVRGVLESKEIFDFFAKFLGKPPLIV